ncbi:MAG TPA: TetR/AcrR family transcriptional regulator [Solirubrobacteraceae bacterium]|nr:TetR/AcrR family transcriptional regulator [Solirubrobacteraceae bacterium]
MADGRGIRGEGRLRLVRAAADCYREGRPEAMTVSRVCKEAGASVGTAYHHFPHGLSEIEDALYLTTVASYQKGFLIALHEHTSAEAGVKAIVRFHLNWMAANLSLAHYLLFFNAGWLSDEHLRDLEQMNARFARQADAWRAPHIESGHLRPLPSMLYGAIILGPAQQFGSQIIGRGSSVDMADTIRRVGPGLADAAWLAVKGDEHRAA